MLDHASGPRRWTRPATGLFCLLFCSELLHCSQLVQCVACLSFNHPESTLLQVVVRKLAYRPRLQGVGWLAPECFRGDGLSKHTDVYAFGILMWELYTSKVGSLDD